MQRLEDPPRLMLEKMRRDAERRLKLKRRPVQLDADYTYSRIKKDLTTARDALAAYNKCPTDGNRIAHADYVRHTVGALERRVWQSMDNFKTKALQDYHAHLTRACEQADALVANEVLAHDGTPRPAFVPPELLQTIPTATEPDIVEAQAKFTSALQVVVANVSEFSRIRPALPTPDVGARAVEAAQHAMRALVYLSFLRSKAQLGVDGLPIAALLSEVERVTDIQKQAIAAAPAEPLPLSFFD